jgi:hypothetical protein
MYRRLGAAVKTRGICVVYRQDYDTVARSALGYLTSEEFK